jgi:indolepyruvate ferredoxin oxidoreductase beta subunit
MLSERPIKLTIAALGGQGGGVLANWLIEIAESEGYLAQSTSVPGVAQRTGATIYYLEFFPQKAAVRAGRDPIMALMPVAGDVDCVLASELAEAGRAIQRGLVTREKTTLIASSHRSYAIGEKSAMGDGTTDAAQLLELARGQSKRLIVFDMEAVAEHHQSVVSSVMLGALSASAVLPFSRAAFEAAIKSGGIAVKTNLAAFEDAYQRAARGGDADEVPRAHGGGELREVPAQAVTPELQPLLDRVRNLPLAAQKLALEGVRRAIDYQDAAYGALYLSRVERVQALDAKHAADGLLTEAMARSLAVWMTFEDTFRVAELKTRVARFARVREDIRAHEGQLFGITEFMKPRLAEIAGTLPEAMGRRILGSPRMGRFLAKWTGGRQIRTGTVTGFLLLHILGGMKRWRRGTLRFREENGRIEAWIEQIERLAVTRYALAVELARAQRLIKGYGETHERGWQNFTQLVDKIEILASRDDGAAVLARLQEAALADEEGIALARELADLRDPSIAALAST